MKYELGDTVNWKLHGSKVDGKATLIYRKMRTL